MGSGMARGCHKAGTTGRASSKSVRRTALWVARGGVVPTGHSHHSVPRVGRDGPEIYLPGGPHETG